jgi:hypothetical protein
VIRRFPHSRLHFRLRQRHCQLVSDSYQLYKGNANLDIASSLGRTWFSSSEVAGSTPDAADGEIDSEEESDRRFGSDIVAGQVSAELLAAYPSVTYTPLRAFDRPPQVRSSCTSSFRRRAAAGLISGDTAPKLSRSGSSQIRSKRHLSVYPGPEVNPPVSACFFPFLARRAELKQAN